VTGLDRAGADRLVPEIAAGWADGAVSAWHDPVVGYAAALVAAEAGVPPVFARAWARDGVLPGPRAARAFAALVGTPVWRDWVARVAAWLPVGEDAGLWRAAGFEPAEAVAVASRPDRPDPLVLSAMAGLAR
jgi:hypothetical protein